MRVVVGGPPHSGKSVLTVSLIQLVEESLPDSTTFRYFPLDLSDNTVGWILYGQQRKKKGVWTSANALKRQGEFAACEHPLQLGDSPGLITKHTRILLSPADKIMILSRSPAGIRRWTQLARELQLDVFAILESVPAGSPYPAIWDGRRRRGRLRGLERGPVSFGGYRALPEETVDVVRELAADLLDLVP